jgi:hypothetical protein
VSALVTETTRALGSDGADSVRTALGIAPLVVLLVVLVLREMGRGALGEERAVRLERVRFATLALSAMFVAVVVPRIVELLT